MFTPTAVCKAFFAFCFTTIFFAAPAQESSIPFGQFLTEELDLKECSFDKSADAVILLDEASANFDERYNLIMERRIRIKILKEKGIERGNVNIPYYSADDFEYISNINAVVLTPGANGLLTTNVLENRNIFNRKMNRLYSMYTFALPNVKVGSIIDYKYRSIMKNYAGLRKWDFQTELPVVTSSFELAPIPNTEFAYSVYKNAEYPIQITPNKAAGRYRFVMNNVPGLRGEVYTASTANFLQRVNFQFASYTDYYGKKTYTSTWDQLAKELLDESAFGSQAGKNLSATPLLKSLAPTLSATEKVKAIYDYVRSNIVWDGISSKYSEDGVKSVLEKKKGNSGDINLLLVSLLKSAGLEVYPMLVSERDHGRIDTTYSYLGQFNKVAALVVCDGNQYVLDGTETNTPFFMVPPDLLNTIAFVVDKKKSRFVYFDHLAQRQSEGIILRGNVSKEGELEGSAIIENREYAKLEKEGRYKSDKAQYREALVKPYSFLKVDSFAVEGLKNDSVALRQTVNYHYSLKKAGAYYLLSANLFTGLIENPFITQYRFTDIDFGSKYSTTVSASFTLPPSFTTEPLPQNKKLVSPDRAMSVSRLVQKKDNVIDFRFVIQIDKEMFKADEYETVRAFFNEMVDLLNEPVLLKSN
jgi:hypothetical protein